MQSELDKFLVLMGFDNQYMPKEYVGDIFHYTSPNGFNSILFGDTEKITLWASRHDCLNDKSEGTIAIAMYKEVCEEMRRENKLTDEMYTLVSDITPAHTILMYREVGDTINITRPEFERFVCSFSKNKDSLVMWNYYSKGNKYEGYNIGLNASLSKESLERLFKNKEVNVHIYPIIYGKKEQKELIKGLLQKLQELYIDGCEAQVRYCISNQLLEWSLIFKSEYFQHEEEVRIIIDVARRTQNGMLKPRPIDVKYRINCGFIIPYIELKIDTDVLQEVCIGPLQCDDVQKQLQKKLLDEWLVSKDYISVATSYSNIPVRY